MKALPEFDNLDKFLGKNRNIGPTEETTETHKLRGVKGINLQNPGDASSEIVTSTSKTRNAPENPAQKWSAN